MPLSTPSSPTPAGRRLRVWIAALVALLTIGCLTVFAQAQGGADATLTTDKADYHPGEVVHVSGTGFEPNTRYAMPVQRPNGSIVVIDPTTHTATPGWEYATADANGDLNYNYQLNGVEGTYEVRAYPENWSDPNNSDQWTGDWNNVAPLASATFTDAAIPNSSSMVTWRTQPSGAWINGTLNANNSDYKEGETIPFRIELGTLNTSGNPYTAKICRDYQQPDGTSGYTTLQPFDTSRAATPGGTITSTAGPFSGVNINNLSFNETGGPGACGSTQRETVVTFNATANGPQYLLWGGRLASPIDPGVGVGKSASFYPGGSLQMRLESPDKTAGINPSGIIQLATITVHKIVDSGTANPWDWGFNLSPNPNNETLPKQPATNSNSVTFAGLNTGSFNITETNVPGYSFASGAGTNCTFNGSTAAATVTAAAGGATNADCTFHNALDTAKLELRKSTVPTSDPGTFNLFAKQGGVTKVSALGVGNGGSSGAGGTSLPSGSYDLSETSAGQTDLSKYSQALACKNRGDNSTVPVTNGSVTLAKNADVVCTFTNTRQQGSIELKKNWVGTGGQTTLNIGTQANGSQTASQQTGANGNAPLTSGAKTVDSGTYYVSETGGLANYDSSLACFNDNGAGTPANANNGTKDAGEANVSADANGGVSVGKNDVVVCTFTNTRQQGSIELKKNWVGTGGQTTLNIGTQANGSQTASQQTGANGNAPLTSGAKTVDSGTYYVSETGGLANYDSSLACFNDNGAGTPANANNGTKDAGEANVSADANGGVSVGKNDVVVCTFTNTRQQGSIELKKNWVGTGGQTTLNIGTQANGSQTASQQTGANGNAPLTSGAKTVDSGTYYVSETGGLANYDSSLACFNDNGAGTPANANNGTKDAGEANVSADANGGVSVGKNDVVVCTFTNTRQQGSIELKKNWVGTGGQTTLNIGTQANGSQTASQQTGANGNAPLTTGAKTVDSGTYYVSETGGLANYDSSLACFNDNGAGTPANANNGTKDAGEANVSADANGGVSVGKNDVVVCTFTNTRQQGSIELKKNWVGTGGQTTLNIGTQANGSQTASQQTGANGNAPLTTGAKTVDSGTYYVSETGGLANYDSSLACFNDNGAGTPANANNGTKDAGEANVSADANGGVSVGKNDVVVCTFTNTRQQGSIELKKNWVGTGGQTTLNIGTQANGSQTASQQTGANGNAPLTTGAKTVDSGTYYVSETGGLANYDSSLACFNDNGAGTPANANNGTKDAGEANVSADANGGVAVGKNDVVVCTFTNTRQQGSIELKKNWVGTGGQTTLNIGTQANGSQTASQQTGANGNAPLTSGAKTVDSGTFYVSETGGLANYDSSLACFNDNGAGTPANANNGTKDAGEANVSADANGGVSVGKNDVVVCTFTNTRQQGSIELKKNWVGTGGQTTLNIGTQANGSQTASQQTGANGNARLQPARRRSTAAPTTSPRPAAWPTMTPRWPALTTTAPAPQPTPTTAPRTPARPTSAPTPTAASRWARTTSSSAPSPTPASRARSS